MSVVRYERRDRVAYVTLDRPEVLNAMNLAMHEELARIWEDIEADDSIWVEAAKTLNIVDPDIVIKFRDQTRPLFVAAFAPDAEADIRRTFDILVETSGPALFGMPKLPDGFLTLEYQ